MLPYQVGLEIVFSVADVVAAFLVAIPALEVAVLLVLMTDVVCLSFKGLCVLASRPCASEGGDILCIIC